MEFCDGPAISKMSLSKKNNITHFKQSVITSQIYCKNKILSVSEKIIDRSGSNSIASFSHKGCNMCRPKPHPSKVQCFKYVLYIPCIFVPIKWSVTTSHTKQAGRLENQFQLPSTLVEWFVDEENLVVHSQHFPDERTSTSHVGKHDRERSSVFHIQRFNMFNVSDGSCQLVSKFHKC